MALHPKRRRLNTKTSEEVEPRIRLTSDGIVGDKHIVDEFKNLYTSCAESIRGEKKQVEKQDSIVGDFNEAMKQVCLKYGQWPEYFRRIMVAVCQTYTMRFVDLGEIELITLLYCAEGEHWLRAHSGTLWAYFKWWLACI